MTKVASFVLGTVPVWISENVFFLIRKNFLTDIRNILYIQSSFKY